MDIATVFSRSCQGIQAPLITIEVHASKGLPGMTIVGLPEKAVKESKDRVRSAILNTGFEIKPRRYTINLAPADVPKEGGAFDLAIAIGILAASEQLPANALDQFEFMGELSLTGELRSIRGALPAALAADRAGRTLIVSQDNPELAHLDKQYKVRLATHLLDVTGKLIQQQALPDLTSISLPAATPTQQLDLKDVKGQTTARRALEIAASGGHSLLFIGPPGTGKSMLASRLPSIMPNITEAEALEVTALYSLCRQRGQTDLARQRPYRSPHHTTSAIALIGGGRPPMPGEVSLAHHGVLFMDELPEFGRHTLEVLREPLETGHVNISRAAHQVTYPAAFQLVAAMNPCPCGYYGDPTHSCDCSKEMILRYQTRLSGPLLDRIDMQTEVTPLPRHLLLDMSTDPAAEDSTSVQKRVQAAYDKQIQRQNKHNARMSQTDIKQFCALATAEQTYLLEVANNLNLSARAYFRLLKVARTIADLADADNIQQCHIQEAVSYRRQLDR